MTQQEKATQPERAETTPTRFVNAGEVLDARKRAFSTDQGYFIGTNGCVRVKIVGRIRCCIGCAL